MSTAWLQKAFDDLAGKSSEEAQEILRGWVTSRLLTMGDYSDLADRLTAAYLERDARRAAELKAMPRSKTGKLPQLGADKAPKAKTAKLPPLPPLKPAFPAGPPTTMPGGNGLGGGEEAAQNLPRPPSLGTRPLHSGRTEPLGERFRSRRPGSK